MSTLKYVLIEPKVEATATVIWLHGLGSNGHDFEGVLPELNLPEDAPIRFIFPHSPSIAVTINGGAIMPAWYDIMSMGLKRELNAQQLLGSARQVSLLIDQECAKGISSDRIILAGFSQGGAVAYQTALSYPKPLAGLLTLSTYFPTSHSIKYSEANRELPIEVMHGDFDPVVLPEMGQDAVNDLIAAHFKPNWSTYPMEHSVCMEEIKDIAVWLKKTLNL
jgi:phospholipase/carboxylesterase